MSQTSSRDFGTLTVLIDRDLCIGSGNCAKVAPEVFELDDTGVIAFRDDAPSDADPARVREACQVCPVDALIVRDGEGNQIVP